MRLYWCVEKWQRCGKRRAHSDRGSYGFNSVGRAVARQLFESNRRGSASFSNHVSETTGDYKMVLDGKTCAESGRRGHMT
jgi:hypothetical protein